MRSASSRARSCCARTRPRGLREDVLLGLRLEPLRRRVAGVGDRRASGSARSTRATTGSPRRTLRPLGGRVGDPPRRRASAVRRCAPPEMAQRIVPMIAYEDAARRHRLAHAGVRLQERRTTVRHGGRDDRARRARDRRRERDARDPEPRIPEPAHAPRDAARPHVAGSTTRGWSTASSSRWTTSRPPHARSRSRRER